MMEFSPSLGHRMWLAETKFKERLSKGGEGGSLLMETCVVERRVLNGHVRLRV